MRRHSVVLFLILASACGRPPAEEAPRTAPTPVLAQVRAGPVVLFLGDSLTAGYNLTVAEAFPARVEEELVRRGTPIQAVNGGVSGDTSAGGLRRLDWLMTRRPQLVVVALGGNDGLRGLPPEETEANLRAIVRKVKAAGARVLLCGILMPVNYGPEFRDRFAAVFPRVAKEEDVAFLPFLLEGVAGHPELNLEDGIHPNAEGHRRVARLVLPEVERLLGP